MGPLHGSITGKFKDSVLFRLAAFNPSVSINNGRASFVEQQLQQVFNSFHTPNHPPYSLMVKRAIMKLNKENGSTKEAICELIRREYDDFPWAHVTILDFHLRKLCLHRELMCTKNGRYVLWVDEEEAESHGNGVNEHKNAVGVDKWQGWMTQTQSEAE